MKHLLLQQNMEEILQGGDNGVYAGVYDGEEKLVYIIQIEEMLVYMMGRRS